MKAYEVITDISDSPYLVLADSLTEVESKMQTQGDIKTFVNILQVNQLKYDSSHIKQ